MKSAICLLLLATAFAQQKPAPPKPTTAPKTYACVAGPDEVCASDLWFSDYQKLQALHKKYDAPQDIQDQMTGIAYRLNAQIPQGFEWNDAKQRYTRKTAREYPPTPPPARPPTPPEPPKK